MVPNTGQRRLLYSSLRESGSSRPRGRDRVVGIVDRGPAEGNVPSSGPAGGLDALAATQNEGFLTIATRLSRTSWVLLQGTIGILDRRLAVVAVMFVLLIAASTLVFDHYLGLLDALYFVVVTFATVGYGDINLLGAPAEIKVYGILAIMFGALTLALAFGLVTDAIVGARLSGRWASTRCRGATTSSSVALVPPAPPLSRPWRGRESAASPRS
jgi:hypothetical protein